LNGLTTASAQSQARTREIPAPFDIELTSARHDAIEAVDGTCDVGLIQRDDAGLRESREIAGIDFQCTLVIGLRAGVVAEIAPDLAEPCPQLGALRRERERVLELRFGLFQPIELM